jgi:hypothetical protein
MGMRTILSPIPGYLLSLVDALRARLLAPDFIAKHRVRPQDFTRHRQLTFPVVMLFVLQKTVKSIQNHLDEFLNRLAGGEVFEESLTPGAWTHARAKLKHTAFVELNEQVVLPVASRSQPGQELRLWHDYRLVGIDSSLLRLPNSPELFQEFTPVETGNQLGSSGIRYPEGRMSVLYDLLNNVGLDARLEPSSVDETDLAIQQLQRLRPGDLTLSDRGFPGYVYFAWHRKLGLDFVARCSKASFGAAQELFRMDRAGRSVRVRLMPTREQRAEVQRLGLPMELVVRFVSVRLSTGELEVLATSLLDEERYPTEEFLALYHDRWGHETFYGTMKGRLDLENFSGQTVEAVRQDFFATLLLCNLESVLTEPAAQALRQESAQHKHPKQVNRAVAFHALKDRMLDLLCSDLPAETVVANLQVLFTGSAVSVRPERKVPRRKPTLNRSYHFQRRVRKIVF